MVSGNNTPNKFKASGMTASKSNLVDVTIINEFLIELWKHLKMV